MQSAQFALSIKGGGAVTGGSKCLYAVLSFGNKLFSVAEDNSPRREAGAIVNASGGRVGESLLLQSRPIPIFGIAAH